MSSSASPWPQAVRREIDRLARALFAPLLRDGGLPAGCEVVGLDAEQGISLTLKRDEVVLLVEFEPLDLARDCSARTKLFNVCVRRPFEPGCPLDAQDRRLVSQVVSLVRSREQRLPRFDRPTTSRKGAVRQILVDQVLIPEGQGQYYINPYVGCSIGCDYCFVAERADLSRRLEGLPRLRWGHFVDVKVNAPEVLRQEVRRHPPGPVRLSPILTDPYQPLERRYRITRQCLQILFEAGFPAVVLTRAPRLLEDLELFARYRHLGLVGFSIPTDNDRVRQIFEPGADPVEERFEALERCHAAGVAAMAFIQPILPMDVEALVERVAPFVMAVRIDRMYFLEPLLARYREHGLEAAATDAFFEETADQLRRAFRARGVEVDDLDDLHRIFTRVAARV